VVFCRIVAHALSIHAAGDHHREFLGERNPFLKHAARGVEVPPHLLRFLTATETDLTIAVITERRCLETTGPNDGAHVHSPGGKCQHQNSVFDLKGATLSSKLDSLFEASWRDGSH